MAGLPERFTKDWLWSKTVLGYPILVGSGEFTHFRTYLSRFYNKGPNFAQNQWYHFGG